MSLILATRFMTDMKLPIQNALKFCQRCYTSPTLKIQAGSQQYRELGLSYSKIIHLRHKLMSSRPNRISVAQFCTSQQRFGPDEDDTKLRDRFKDDSQANEYLKEMARDFSLEKDEGQFCDLKFHVGECYCVQTSRKHAYTLKRMSLEPELRRTSHSNIVCYQSKVHVWTTNYSMK